MSESAYCKTINPTYVPNSRTPPTSNCYTCWNIPEEFSEGIEKIGNLIGINGKIFKAITHQSGANYIWYDNGKVEIWGNTEYCVKNALSRVQKRYIDHCCNSESN